MNECTNNMSKTTYTLESLKSLIQDKQEFDLDWFCKYLTEDFTDKQILKEVKKRAENICKTA